MQEIVTQGVYFTVNFKLLYHCLKTPQTFMSLTSIINCDSCYIFGSVCDKTSYFYFNHFIIEGFYGSQTYISGTDAKCVKLLEY